MDGAPAGFISRIDLRHNETCYSIAINRSTMDGAPAGCMYGSLSNKVNSSYRWGETGDL